MVGRSSIEVSRHQVQVQVIICMYRWELGCEVYPYSTRDYSKFLVKGTNHARHVIIPWHVQYVGLPKRRHY